MAETTATKNKIIKCKVISKNPSKSRVVGDKRIISVSYNHNRFKFNEGVEIELPAGLVKMLKIHMTKKIVPSGNNSVKAKNFKTEIYNTFEVIEL